MLNSDRCRLRVPADVVRSPEIREMLEAEIHPFRTFRASVLRERFIARLRGDA